MDDLIYGGCTFQGLVRISQFDEDGVEHLLYEGEGESIPTDVPWSATSPMYIFYSEYDQCIHIEL